MRLGKSIDRRGIEGDYRTESRSWSDGSDLDTYTQGQTNDKIVNSTLPEITDGASVVILLSVIISFMMG